MDNPKPNGRGTGDRDAKGRFVDGNGVSVGKGRPRNEWKLAVEQALINRFPGEYIAGLYADAISIGKDTKSGKVLANVANDIQDRVVGKPTIRIETNESNAMEEAVERMMAIEEDE